MPVFPGMRCSAFRRFQVGCSSSRSPEEVAVVPGKCRSNDKLPEGRDGDGVKCAVCVSRTFQKVIRNVIIILHQSLFR